MQKQAANFQAEVDDVRAQMADLQSQVQEAHAHLKLETEGRVRAAEEVARVTEGLEAMSTSYYEMKEEHEKKCKDCDDLSGKVCCPLYLRRYTEDICDI